MTRTARTAIAIATTLAAVIALPTAAAAQVRYQRAPVHQLQRRPVRIQVRAQNGVSYRRAVEQGLALSQRRIDDALRRRPVRLSTYQRIVNDLTEARRLIRTRVAAATADGQVTVAEQQQVGMLVDAIAADLSQTYGPIDSWRLL